MADVNKPGGSAPTAGEPSPQADSQTQHTPFERSASNDAGPSSQDGKPVPYDRFQVVNQNWRDEQGRSAQLQRDNENLRAQLSQQPRPGGIDDHLQQALPPTGLVQPGMNPADVQAMVAAQVNAQIGQFRSEQAQADHQRQAQQWLDRARAEIPFTPEAQAIGQQIYQDMPGLQNIPEGQYIASRLAQEQMTRTQEPQVANQQNMLRRQSQLESPAAAPAQTTQAQRQSGMQSLAQIPMNAPDRDQQFAGYLEKSGLIDRRTD